MAFIRLFGIRGILCAAGALVFGLLSGAHAEEVSFDRDIRPILSDKCFQCHGPDPHSRKADLRLDHYEDATADRDGAPVIVPGDASAGTLLERVTATVASDRMPPPEVGDPLTPDEVAKLRAWIDGGAEYVPHWAFTAPTRPATPDVSNKVWVNNPIDAFVLARLEEEGVQPAERADDLTLLRRLHLDLTGLPPTLQEIDAYLADAPETRYANAVDRLLASPHYGERWARHWLDAAQYADSDGFEKDKPRQVWAWRDYVINAFNDNMPYDQFVREQIAGDLMPDATTDQKVATGFLRNSMINEEGGIDPEQFRMEALFNRMDIIGRAVMGLTVACAQCHTHKYDPLTQTEYYRMLAYLNNSHEAQMTVYSEEEEARRTEIYETITALDEEAQAAHPDWKADLAAWEGGVRTAPAPDWTPVELTFDDSSAGGQKFLPQGDGSYLAQGYAPSRFAPKMNGPSPLKTITAVKLELLPDPNLPRGGPGRSIYGACALTQFELRVMPPDAAIKDFGQWEVAPVASAIADVNPPKRPLGPEFPDKGDRKAFVGPIEMAIDGDGNTAWTIDNGPGRRNQARYAIFKLAEPLTVLEGAQIAFQLHQQHGGHNSDDNQTNNIGRFRLSVTDATELPDAAHPVAIRQIIARDPEARTTDQQDKLFRYWRTTQPAFALANINTELAWKDHPQGTTQLVYREREEPRTTHRLDRGNFLAPAEVVEPGVPAFLNPAPEGAPPNRLALAEWLTREEAPTTARAFVNRVWLHHFGEGIVRTPADLGLQGAPPTHPELIDWLAVEFMASGWDVKALHRTIVSSATYQQSSKLTPALIARDPDNKLLARGARYRVEGEIVRDIALTASGLLAREVGGPSVHPPAPAFLFEPPASYGPKPWPVSEGPDRYRRGLYTFRFRSVPHPVLQAFDTPAGDTPCVGRDRSNTPLQALTGLNETTFMTCAQALAKETLENTATTDADRIAFAFRRCTSRTPDDAETQRLLQFVNAQRDRIAAGELDPAAILTNENDPVQRTPERAAEELAAWTLTARVLLNLDETITRE
jgi:hypothetical protein